MLRPFDLQQDEANALPEEINNILIDAGLAPKKEERLKLDATREIFTKSGASLEKAAATISNVMSNGETDAGRLKAAELALRVHGILQELDDKPIPVINISIAGTGNRTLVNLVLPSN